MNERIVFTRPGGGVSVIVPTGEVPVAELMQKDVPGYAINARQVTTAELPSNRLYRNAWDDSNPENFVGVDLPKAREIAHTRRRAKRDEVFAPHQEITAKAAQGIPLKAGESATVAQQAMTDYKTNVDDVAQAAIDSAATVDDLEVIETTNSFI